MTTWKQLSRPLRAFMAAPWLLIAAAVALGSTPAFRQLLLDTANHPTTAVDFGSANWTGTINTANLPSSVPLLDGNNDLALPGNQATLASVGSLYLSNISLVNDGSASFAGGQLLFDTSGGIYANALSIASTCGIDSAGVGTFSQLYADSAAISSDGSGNLNMNGSLAVGGGLYWQGYPIAVDGSLYAGGNVIADTAGNIIAINGVVVGYANYHLMDADGFLYTGSQRLAPLNSQPSGWSSTPTGYLTLKDGDGTTYYVEARPAP